MRFLVRGEFREETLKGRTTEESALYFQQVIMPSVEALWNVADGERVARGLSLGGLESVFVVDAGSGEEVGRLLGSLPFRGAVRWTVSPIKSLQSALQEHRQSKRAVRTMVVER
jgi:hypothetical protein